MNSSVWGSLIEGVVSANETVEFFGTEPLTTHNFQTGIIRSVFVVDDDEDNALARKATLDSSVPRVSGVFANDKDSNVLITDGSFIKEPLRSITVTGADDSGDDSGEIDLGNRRTTIFLRMNGVLWCAEPPLTTTADITFTLINPLDIPSENGKYTLILILIDKAGNVIQSVREFTFDNVKPSLKRVSTNRGGLIPGAGVSQRLNYVEAVLTDNLEDGIDLFASTIYLDRIGTDGPTRIPGEKTEDAGGGRIRWTLLTPLLGGDDSEDGEYTIKVKAVDKAGNKADPPVQVSFRYDNRAPRLVSVSPMDSEESL